MRRTGLLWPRWKKIHYDLRTVNTLRVRYETRGVSAGICFLQWLCEGSDRVSQPRREREVRWRASCGADAGEREARSLRRGSQVHSRGLVITVAVRRSDGALATVGVRSRYWNTRLERRRKFFGRSRFDISSALAFLASWLITNTKESETACLRRDNRLCKD